ncbi:MAG TPA: 50S ribosomal protein L29 [Candidatus Omnitrophota bacterium]|nr:50S ribosomal protein L29 [Candidatus Omnitrophota bacterium]HPB67478.1 50S ribosomal protein L29 [Candidatus Omnitrophota bacterium]HQO57475.1 50S ribosomal protein L29 [Candidatus Omnitrophota bacterium]HQP11495.1 50S ribosomal protein L29 [Candidatus Omnitrophota bacterium]
MKAKDLRNLSQEDLGQKEKAFKKDLFDLRYQRKIGRVERPSMFKLIKRDIARIQTILNERKTDGNKA